MAAAPEEISANVFFDDEILKRMIKYVKEVGLNKHTRQIVLKQLMEEIELSAKKGTDQKSYALALFRKLAVDYGDKTDKTQLLSAIDDGLIGDTIELVVSASKGDININKIKETCCLFF